MGLGKARGGFRLKGRPDEARREDERRLEALVELLPLDAATRVVETVLRRLTGESLRAAIAFPLLAAYDEPAPAFAMLSAATSGERCQIVGASDSDAGDISLGFSGGGEAYDLPTTSGWMRLRAAVKREAETTEPEADFLTREVATARHELVRDWVNAVQLAWKMWGRSSGGLLLRRVDAEPEASTDGEAYASWLRIREESRLSLVASVALDEAGLGELTHSFASAVSDHCARKALLLPADLVVVSSTSSLSIRSENAVTRAARRSATDL